MRDSTYVLDEILDNETELPIMEHTTDTAGYTELVFAMFDLLGLQFSPRIKDLGGQRLYRAARDSEYQHIESLLSGTIKTDKILARWDDMLRVAGSLKLGWVTASLFLSKLKSFPQQNDLASSLAEYGRTIKTIFIIYMEAAIAQLRSEGHFFSDEDISRLSPTRYEHVNPYGIYPFDIEKESKRVNLRPLRKPSRN